MNDKNKAIINRVRHKINKLKLSAILDIEPIESPAKIRRKYGRYKDGKVKFAVKMWDLNKLDHEALTSAIDKEIFEARKHFKI